MSAIRRAAMRLESWAMDDESAIIGCTKFFALILAATLLVLSPFILLTFHDANTAESQCLSAGGAWAVVGHHVTPVVIGRMIAEGTITDYGCVNVPAAARAPEPQP